jgi:hypothetical protein
VLGIRHEIECCVKTSLQYLTLIVSSFMRVVSCLCRFRRLCGIDFFLQRPVNEKSTLTAANRVAVIINAAAVGVVSSVVDQEAEITTASRKRMIRDSRRRIALIVSLVGVVASVVH